MLLPILTVSLTSLALGQNCFNTFSLRPSSEILKQIVAQFSVERRLIDADGEEWLSLLIPTNTNVKVDGVEYYLNDNRLSPEDTFYFDPLQFYPVPIYIVSSKELLSWRADFPDKTKLLSKISRRCAYDEYLCGLQCCSNQAKLILKTLADRAVGGIIAEKAAVKTQGVVYSVSEVQRDEDAHACVFHLSKKDRLHGLKFSGGEPVTKVHYSCPDTQVCCTLSCIEAPNPQPSAVRLQEESNLLQTYAWPATAVLFIVAFLVILAKSVNCWNRAEKPSLMTLPTTLMGAGQAASCSSQRPLLVGR